MSEQPRIGDHVTAHFIDSEYGSIPSDARGVLSVRVDECSGAIAFLVVGDRAIRPADLVTVHTDECDHRDQRSPKARENFHRKHGYYPEDKR